MKKLSQIVGSRGDAILGLDCPTYIDMRVLAAGVAETVTIPADADYVLFGRNADFYARWDGSAAAIPIADVTTGVGSEINPGLRCIRGLTTFSVIAPSPCILSLSFFAGQQ